MKNASSGVGLARRAAVPFVVLALVRCGAASADAESAGSGGSAGSDLPNDASAAGGSAGNGGGSPIPDAGREEEVESSFLAPVATGRYVWAANPESNRVALIDALSLKLEVRSAGFGPTHLAAIPAPAEASENAAIVLNVRSHDATLFRVDATGTIAAPVTLPTHAGANSWAISPGGRWAIAWTDAAQIENPDPTDGFQEITAISLDRGSERSTRLSVGYRPARISFDSAETRAFVVSEPGISVVELTQSGGANVAELVELSDDPLENPASRDVAITPDGSLALVRRDGSPEISLVPLAGGARGSLKLPGAVTDLDLSHDGRRALAVIRERSQIAVLPIPASASGSIAVESLAIPGENFGSVSLSPDGTVALLYTNATPNDHVTIVNVAGAAPVFQRTVSVKAPVKAVFPTPDGRHALILQVPSEGSSKAGVFSIVPTAAELAPKIVGTDAPPTAVAMNALGGSDRALVTIRDDDKRVFGVYVVRLPSLQVDLLRLASPPLATGVVPDADKGYVAQLHPEGRITFVDLDDGSARTLTGFELGADIVD